MAEPTGPANTNSKPARKPRESAVRAEVATKASKARFTKAIEEAKAGAGLLGTAAQEKAGVYKDQAAAKGTEWLDEAKALGGQAQERAAEYAVQGKAKASEAISSLGKLVEDSAATIDEKLGLKYGDYARKAAGTLQDTAVRLDEKDLAELSEDAKEFVRKSPGVAVGIAAVAGFMLARVFKGSND
jgi:ElaB/YqjD/DUF883 family membrane-anchored ribosome-binding protein